MKRRFDFATRLICVGARPILFGLLMLGCIALVSLTHAVFVLTTYPAVDINEQQSFLPPVQQKKRPAIMKGNKSESLGLLLGSLANMTTVFDATIDLVVEKERCARYGWKIRDDAPIMTRRRIFRGNPVAGDSWHALALVALEGFGVYHHVAFVESNLTHSYVPRNWRFVDGSQELALLQSSGIYGPETTVSVDYYFDNDWDRNNKSSALYENTQRNVLLERWKAQGMTASDIAVFADADETFSRDFLRAAQICDVPEFRPGQSCKHPKISAASLMFEGSLNCLVYGRRWYHPNMMVGECIEHIGDETLHPVVPPEGRGPNGRRLQGYNPDDPELQNATMFPLWNAADFRRTKSGGKKYGVKGESTGLHFHNFFMTEEDVRFKYKTYSHGMGDVADQLELDSLHHDLKLMTKCVRNVSDEGDRRQRVTRNMETNRKLVLPAAFRLEKYRALRHEELTRMVQRAYLK